MPEFLTLLPPDEGRALLLSHLSGREVGSEPIDVPSALGRVTAEDVRAPHPLPEFPRSSVDGYAVRARDTFGASESLPAYLTLIGEVPMGAAPTFSLQSGECALIHTGGMLPANADAVVMLEYTQVAAASPGTAAEIEVLRAVAEGENVIRVGEDVAEGMVILPRGRVIRPAEIGGLMALGILSLRVAKRVRVAILSSGDEIVPPTQRPQPGQVRDINAYTLGALVRKSGGEAVFYGIVADEKNALRAVAERALAECDMVVITAGSSASTRDMTAEVINSLGAPGVLVHGINTRPGKPTILGVCDGKAVIGLPGNPVSALVNGYLFVAPVIEKLLGQSVERPRPYVQARLTVNLPSQAGREDWWPVRLIASGEGEYLAEPIFGKSNLIFTLVAADGLLRIPPAATGLSAGEIVHVRMI
jgi:molybdopterin molybdotransferase